MHITQRLPFAGTKVSLNILLGPRQKGWRLLPRRDGKCAKQIMLDSYYGEAPRKGNSERTFAPSGAKSGHSCALGTGESCLDSDTLPPASKSLFFCGAEPLWERLFQRQPTFSGEGMPRVGPLKVPLYRQPNSWLLSIVRRTVQGAPTQCAAPNEYQRTVAGVPIGAQPAVAFAAAAQRQRRFGSL